MAKFTFIDFAFQNKDNVSDVFEFAKRVCDMGDNAPLGATSALWFRGQSDETWRLDPSIHRTYGFWGPSSQLGAAQTYDVEYQFLNRFRRYAHAFYERELSLWETITLAQHHRLPTRLLDWTSNPLVALYFLAQHDVSGSDTKDGAIYAFRPRTSVTHINVYDDGNPNHPHVNDPRCVKGVKIVYPMMSTQRLVTQSGAFTIQDPTTPLDSQTGNDFADSDLDIHEIMKWRVPANAKPSILRQLERVGMNLRTLFPDLGGVADGLVRGEMLKIVKHEPPKGHLP